MDTIFMNSEKSKKPEPYRLLINLPDKAGLKKSKSMLFYKILVCIKNNACKDNKFKMLPTTQNEKLESPDGSFFISGIQNYFKYLNRKHETVTDNPPIRIYANKIENKITFEIKTGYYLKFQHLKKRKEKKPLGATKIEINKSENCENVPYLEITEVVLIHCNILNNYYQQCSRVLYTFGLNKCLGELLDISPKNFIILKILV